MGNVAARAITNASLMNNKNNEEKATRKVPQHQWFDEIYYDGRGGGLTDWLGSICVCVCVHSRR